MSEQRGTKQAFFQEWSSYLLLPYLVALLGQPTECTWEGDKMLLKDESLPVLLLFQLFIFFSVAIAKGGHHLQRKIPVLSCSALV